jgi:hypothetical protein
MTRPPVGLPIKKRFKQYGEAPAFNGSRLSDIEILGDDIRRSAATTFCCHVNLRESGR